MTVGDDLGTASRAHRWIWVSAVCVLGGVGVVLTFCTVSVPTIAGTGLVGAIVGCIAYPPFYRPGPPPAAPEPRALGRAAASGAAVALALIGLLSLMGPAALLLAALVGAVLAVTSPAAVRCIVRWRLLVAREQETAPEPSGGRGIERLGMGVDRQSPRELTTEQLCRAWRTSFVLLDRTDDSEARTLLSTVRRRYLDELERRDPDGFERWMAAGARAASDPTRYISGTPHEPR